MDTKLIEQCGEEILSYRLRSARQKKRMQREDFDKQLIRLDIERDDLNDKIRKLGWELLDPPVQKGWIRHFVLREDVARSKHAEFFENILKKINTYDYCWKKDFKIKKRKRGRKIYIVKPQKVLSPQSWHFDRLHFSDAEKRMFYEVWEQGPGKGLYKRFVFNEPWRFVLKVRPNMITKIKRKDGALESRVEEIERFFSNNHLSCKLWHIKDGSNRWRYRLGARPWEKNIYKNKNIHQILEMMLDDSSKQGGMVWNNHNNGEN